MQFEKLPVRLYLELLLVRGGGQKQLKVEA
jgi:hypothetical protein